MAELLQNCLLYTSYINHALRVMERMDTEEEKMAAVLHDVVEDTETVSYTHLDVYKRQDYSYRRQLSASECGSADFRIQCPSVYFRG